ncbi:amidase, partial [Salmonella enterica subsp. enterica serovar Typhimurium]|nr:amidase [Salmonella enterica subsp. enterica serovar Typhimurium]
VAKMRQAGALILAKSNLQEFARGGVSISSLGGQVLNPYDLTRNPGGSSGGTGAAIAANFAVMGTGSDTGQSIRSPSSANNLVGVRPT